MTSSQTRCITWYSLQCAVWPHDGAKQQLLVALCPVQWLNSSSRGETQYASTATMPLILRPCYHCIVMLRRKTAAHQNYISYTLLLSSTWAQSSTAAISRRPWCVKTKVTIHCCPHVPSNCMYSCPSAVGEWLRMTGKRYSNRFSNSLSGCSTVQGRSACNF